MVDQTQTKAATLLCMDCCSYHVPPIPCGHDAEAPCRDCGRKRGWRFTVDDGSLYVPADRCFKCSHGLVVQNV